MIFPFTLLNNTDFYLKKAFRSWSWTRPPCSYRARSVDDVSSWRTSFTLTKSRRNAYLGISHLLTLTAPLRLGLTDRGWRTTATDGGEIIKYSKTQLFLRDIISRLGFLNFTTYSLIGTADFRTWVLTPLNTQEQRGWTRLEPWGGWRTRVGENLDPSTTQTSERKYANSISTLIWI